MPPEERRELREREGWRQERLKREADAAMRASGLQLEAERRQQFEARYMQERKRIEQELRRELREKRERELAPVVERLKKEFTQQGGSSSPATTTPAASGSPKQ
jgi:5-formyltetrahydrofolate cyclo-ligase